MDGSASVCCIRQFDVSNWSWIDKNFFQRFWMKVNLKMASQGHFEKEFLPDLDLFALWFFFFFSKEICCSSNLGVCVFLWRGISPKAWGFVFQEWWCSCFFILVAFKISHLCSAHFKIFVAWNRYNPQYFYLKILLPWWHCQLLGLKDWLSNPWVSIYWEGYKN